MTSNNKDILIAKIDVLWQSVQDPQLQTVIALLRDLAANVDVSDKGEIGFGQHTGNTADGISED